MLESGLTFSKKEQYIPNKYGTRGFIDLVAHDAKGRLVLIEVKRTKSAEREAVHEILKYIEGAKRHLGLKEDEVRVFVVSPDWTELFVPFSSLVHRTNCSVTGFKLDVSENGDVLAASEVEPLRWSGDRLIAPWHELRYYIEEDTSNAAISKYESANKEKGIESFVILELHPTDGLEGGIASPKQSTMWDMLSTMSGPTKTKSELPKYKRALYFAMQQLSEEEYLSILKSSKSDISETLEVLEGMEEEEERLNTLHEAILDMKPRPECDFLEIGYPAKIASRLLQDDGWKVHKIHRFGTFERNTILLNDQTIIDEVCGQDGAGYQQYTKKFDPKNKTEVAAVERGIDHCLSENLAWRKQTKEALREIVEMSGTTSVEFKLYNPSTALLTFYLAVSRDDGQKYIPGYSYFRRTVDKEILVFGCLRWDGSKANLETVLRKHYDSSVSAMLFPLNWGGYDAQDSQVMRTIGFRYRTFKIEILGEIRDFFEMTEEGWEECDEIHPLQDFQRVYEEHESLMRDICDLYAEKWSGGAIDLSGMS